MVLSDNSLEILNHRYLLPGETPEDLFSRVANALAPNMTTATEFYGVMTELKFLPNTPCLINAGRDLGQLAACFVLPVEDSIESIFEAVKQAAIIHKSGGGTGFSFSDIRPKGSIVHSTRKASSGPVSFMSVFNSATDAIKQGGIRRGANIGILRVDHPDIEEFIDCKKKDGEFSNFNISVAMTDEFMQNPDRKLFKHIAENMWSNGEPGIIFIDTINRGVKEGELISATNPCGEQPLRPYESCVLGSINLEKHLDSSGFSYSELRKSVEVAIKMLNRMIDVSIYPLPQIEEQTKKSRKIGIGIMGFARTLYKLGIRYGSSECLKFIDELMLTMLDVSSKSKEYTNESRFTIAPTGTISMIADTSSGIEPEYALSYRKNVLGQSFVYTNEFFLETLKQSLSYSDTWIEGIEKNGGSVQGLDSIPEKIQELFVTAHDISPLSHIDVQARFQKYVDNAISKTINLPEDYPPSKVETLIAYAWENGCKGLTIYRNGSRQNQVLTTMEATSFTTPRRRPNRVFGSTTRIETACGPIYFTANTDNDGSLFEVFCGMGKAGGCESSQIEAIGRLISLALRSGVAPIQVIRQLKGIRCNKPFGVGKKAVLSCADCIAKTLAKMTDTDVELSSKNGCCPECTMETQMEEGCEKCSNCGFSRC